MPGLAGRVPVLSDSQSTFLRPPNPRGLCRPSSSGRRRQPADRLPWGADLPGLNPKPKPRAKAPRRSAGGVKSEAAGAPHPVSARKPRREAAGETRAEILEPSLRSVISEGFLRSFFILVIQLGYVFTLQNIHAGVRQVSAALALLETSGGWALATSGAHPTSGAFTPSPHSGPLSM